MATAESYTPPTLETASSPHEFIDAWCREHIGQAGEGMPSFETLMELERTLHALDEFFAPVVRDRIQALADSCDQPWLGEAERPFTMVHVAELIVATDGAREALSQLEATIGEIVLLAHEDVATVARGYIADGTLTSSDEGWRRYLRRFHGLTR